MKLKNVWNVILKVLTHVRTHPEELLVPKIWFSLFFEYQKSKMEFLTIWKNWKMSRMSFWKFSPMCKSTSRRNPRSKNLIFVIFHLFSQKSKRTLGRWENVFKPYDEIESCRTHVEELLVSKIWISCFLSGEVLYTCFLFRLTFFPFDDLVSHQEKNQLQTKKPFSLMISLTKKKVNKHKKPFFR